MPADAVLVQSHDLQTDESLLTGESVPVRKIADGSRSVHGRRPGGDDLPYVFSGSLVVRGDGNRRGHRDRRAQRNRQDRPVAQHAGDRAAAAAGADPAAGADLRDGRGRGQRSGGAALRHLARRMARCGAGRHRARHVDAAGGVSGRAHRVHGDGRVADLAGARADAARRRHRNARLGDGAVYRQDRHADREPHVHRRVAAQERRRSSGPARRPAQTMPEDFHDLVEFGLLASARDPFDPMEKAFHDLGRAQLAETEHLHGPRMDAGARLWASPRSARHVARLAGRRRQTRVRHRGQGRAGSHRRSLPPRRRGSRRADAVRGRHGRRGPARAGRRPRVLRGAAHGRSRSTISPSSSWASSALPIRCGRACPMR